MEKEVIKIDPTLNKSHHEDFIKFCKELKRAMSNRDGEEKYQYLFQLREKIEDNFSGNNLHDNISLYFLESLMIDLLLQDWEIKVLGENVELELQTSDDSKLNLKEEKAKTRRRHLLARNTQLQAESVFTFIKGMEKKKLTNKGWFSIFSLMRDGNDLQKKLREVVNSIDEAKRVDALNSIVKPYIQFVEPGERCEITGLMLSGIWRYFRHTWINEYKSLPGRSISILIRDAAAPNHPVIGIAALGSSVAQQSCRDKWIGWDGSAFLERIKQNPSPKYGKWILETLDMLLKEVYIRDFIIQNIITKADLKNPTVEKVKKLRELSIKFRKEHVDNPHTAKFTVGNKELSWEERAQTKLFKSKRAGLLAELLLVKFVLNKYHFKKGTKKELETCLQKADFKDAIEKLIRKAKAIHVGINMMDIIVCGSVAPYNHLLGGKLVCMMLTSPEVTAFYNKKYGNAVSLIASSMNGKAVVRKPQLVMLGTTSLYGVGSSQYNRIKIPTNEIGGATNGKVEYKELGFSEGYGSFHFSSDTIWLADKVAGINNNGRKKVNSIFGEGANPLFRKLKGALEHLKLESNPILNHRNRRVVYGISLAENFDEVLIGLTKGAKYLFPQTKSKEKTELIGKFWIKRWLQNRILNEEILQQVSGHTLTYPITHGAKVPLKEEEESPRLF
jgi:hypothetical protein